MSANQVHLTPQLVQAIRDAVDIVAIASEHTRLKKAGARYSGLCPLHKEKSPSFSVDPVQGLFYCFGCGRGGDAIRLHMQVSGDDFPGAIETLARQYAIPLPTRAARPGERDKSSRIVAALEAAQEYFIDQMRRASGPRNYLELRSIGKEWIDTFGIGFAPDSWSDLRETLQKTVPTDDLILAGLVGRSEKSGKLYDRFRNRLMFPIQTATGRLVGFGGRTLDGDRAKYVNTSETDQFRKGTLLYGLYQAKKAIRDSGEAILVEGYFDVIGAAAAGVEGAVAGMGTSLTADQARLLGRYAEEVVLGYDGDEAGQKAYRRSLPLLLGERLGVRRLALGDLDPDSYRIEHGNEALQQAVREAVDAVVSEINRLTPGEAHSNPRLQAKAAEQIIELIKPIPDAILRYGYGRRAADRLGLPVDLLWKRFGVDRSAIHDAAADEKAQQPTSRRTVRSTEQRLVELLLTGKAVPPLGELPAEHVFRDDRCRNIFRVFCALYKSGERPPEAREVLAELANDRGSVDEIAQLLLETNVAAVDGEAQVCAHKLERRWSQSRLRELASEIRGAQEHNDIVRLESLIEERTLLSRSLHGRSAS